MLRLIQSLVFVLALSAPAHAGLDLRSFAPADNDRATNLGVDIAFDRLDVMEAHGKETGHLIDPPWSGFGWSTFKGGLANRYADPAYRATSTWLQNYNYLLPRLGQGARDLLSPAEKYDLLVGDEAFSLSRAAFAQGSTDLARDGEVARWHGLCHGWAPASVTVPRPLHDVTALAPDGSQVTFAAEDISALATLLWARGDYDYHLVGGRCEQARVKRGKLGRPLDPNCLDTNPATWHLAVVNTVGLGQPLLLDNAYQEEVWNVPVYSYSYRYVRPGRKGYVATAAEARRPLGPRDPRREFRAPGAVATVEVEMKITIVAGREPAREKREDRRLDRVYHYELELGADDSILGGEWLKDDHPDFLWTPDFRGPALSLGDRRLSEAGDAASWADGSPVPETWRQAAKETAPRYEPLARIVNELVRRSRL